MFTTSGQAARSGRGSVTSRSSASLPIPTSPIARAKRTLLTFDQPQNNHNGGWIGFSPRVGDEDNLYIATGDGGNANDQGPGHIEPGGNSQNTTTLLGKMLRIHPNDRPPAVIRSRPTIPLPDRRPTSRRSGLSVCAIRSATVSIGCSALSSSATSARIRARKSTPSPPPTPAAVKTTAGGCGKVSSKIRLSRTIPSRPTRSIRPTDYPHSVGQDGDRRLRLSREQAISSAARHLRLCRLSRRVRRSTGDLHRGEHFDSRCLFPRALQSGAGEDSRRIPSTHHQPDFSRLAR